MSLQNLMNVENELQPILESDKRNWIRTAQLLLEADRNKLYQPEYKNLTTWVHSLSKRYGIHASNFWRVKKAGEAYLKLQGEEDIALADLSKLNTAKTTPEQIELMTKISRFAPDDVVESLEQKLMAGQTKLGEMREIWRTYRPDDFRRRMKGPKEQEFSLDTVENISNVERQRLKLYMEHRSVPYISRQNGKWIDEKSGEVVTDKDYDMIKERLEEKLQSLLSISSANKLTAPDMIHSLTGKEWITTLFKQYDTFKEVTLRTKNSSSSKHFDLVIYGRSSYSQLKPEVTGIVIKSTLEELQAKFSVKEIQLFCDAFYVAVPNDKEVLKEAEKLPRSVGLLIVNQDLKTDISGRYPVFVKRKPIPHEASTSGIQKMLHTLMMKQCGWL